MHDWLHMRWASVTRDPSNGAPVMTDRFPADFAAHPMDGPYDCQAGL